MIALLNKLDAAATKLSVMTRATDDAARLKAMMDEVANDLRDAYDLGSEQWGDLRRAMEFLEKGKRRS